MQINYGIYIILELNLGVFVGKPLTRASVVMEKVLKILIYVIFTWLVLVIFSTIIPEINRRSTVKPSFNELIGTHKSVR